MDTSQPHPKSPEPAEFTGKPLIALTMAQVMPAGRLSQISDRVIGSNPLLVKSML